MTTPLTDYLEKPGNLTKALGRHMTQTNGDWSPDDSLWLFAWRREPEARARLLALAKAYVEIAEARPEWGQQIDMPMKFAKHFGASDTKFGGFDENHFPMRILHDIARELSYSDSVEARAIAELAVIAQLEHMAKYGGQKNSYMTVGGTLDSAGKLKKYLGDTGRVRKAANILAAFDDTIGILHLPGFDLPPGPVANALCGFLRFHLGELNKGLPADDPKDDHLPQSQYLCLFQLGMLVAATKRLMRRASYPKDILDMASGVRVQCSKWVMRGLKRDDSGAITGAYYDVKYPDWENTATAPGNADWTDAKGSHKAHDGMGVALHLGGITDELDAFLAQAKAKADPYPLRLKFGVVK